MIFGKKIRELRDEQGVLQRQLAALLEIDTPMFSKIERGDRRAKRKHVIKLAEYLHQDEKEMLMLWLADKVLDAVGDDELSYDAITVAQEQIQKGHRKTVPMTLDMEKLNEDYHTEKYLRHQQIHEMLDLLALFEKPDTAKLVREVAIVLMGGRYVSIPCAGGGSVSSETGWDGFKKDEENEGFRLRCWLHAAKTIKASRYVPTKRRGYGL